MVSLFLCAGQREGDEEEKPSRIELENQRRFGEVSSNDDEFNDNRVLQSSGVNGTDFVFFLQFHNHRIYW